MSSKKENQSGKRYYSNQYDKIVKNVPIIITNQINSTNLSQPSLLESVNSITTYQVTNLEKK